MAKRTIYVREEDQALFDKLAEEGNLSAIIARAVKAEQGESVAPRPLHREFALHGHMLEFSVAPDEKPGAMIQQIMQVDPLTIVVGSGLLPFVDPAQGAALLERIGSVRRHVALELGFVMSGVRLRDNLQLRAGEYSIRVREVEAGRGELKPGMWLAVGSANRPLPKSLKGVRTTDPTYNLPAIWVASEQREQAESAGLHVFDCVSVIATHLTHTVRRYAPTLLGLQEAQALLDQLQKTHPTLIEHAVSEEFNLVDWWHVFRRLLREQVSIRDLPLILESALSLPAAQRTVESVVTRAREALSRSLCAEYTDAKGDMYVYELPEDWDVHASLEELRRLEQSERVPIVLTDSRSRAAVWDALSPLLPNVVVLSRQEIPPGVQLKSAI